MTLENLADKVKDMRALQKRRDKAQSQGLKKKEEYKALYKQCFEAEQEVDKILMKHFYTPEKKQSNLF